MSVEENKATIRRLTEEVANKGNMAIIPDLVAPNFVFHTTPEIKGPEGVKQYFTNVRTASPDFHQTIDNMVAEGDMVAVFYTDRGTFKSEVAGIAPTGKKFTTPSAVLSRFEGSKIVENWGYLDRLTYYRQLGIPIPKE